MISSRRLSKEVRPGRWNEVFVMMGLEEYLMVSRRFDVTENLSASERIEDSASS